YACSDSQLLTPLCCNDIHDVTPRVSAFVGLFLAYALFKDFVVYQMDVKSAFLYGKIEEEIYVCQPSGFEDHDFPEKVYKVEKALCRLYQALRAWYETLSTYLLDNGFQRGKIDKNLFIRRHKEFSYCNHTRFTNRGARGLSKYGDEHLSTIPEKGLGKVIKSSVENLVPILRESKDLTDYESECDMPIYDDSSSKNEGLDDIVSIPSGKEIDHLDAIPDSVQSLLNRANLIIFLIEEFVDELALINPIPRGIVEADFDPKEYIRLIKKLLNNDSPHSLEELNSEIPNAMIEYFSSSPTPVEDSDSLMEEIDIFLATDDSIPSGIENDDYD
nr:retrovirus-related Pol polyprotein from transposon TNT 1-94 [Tanacetum cinerariifolium]